MKRMLALLPMLLLAACGGTPDVVPTDDAAPDAAMVDTATPDGAPSDAGALEPTIVDEPAPDGALAVDYDASEITFVGKSSIVDHPGSFKKFRVVMLQQEEDWLKTSFRFDVDLRQIVTDNEMLDGHLQKEDFFDTANHPVATFESDGGVWPRDDGGYEIDGPLTVKGVTSTVTVRFMKEDNALRFSLDFPRKTFGVGNDSYGDKLLDDVMPVEGTIVLQ